MLRRYRISLFLGVFSFALLATLRTAVAAGVQVLHIDQGFLGHPVKLDLSDGAVRIAWQAGDVLRPSDINFSVSSSSEINIVWSSSYALAGNGVELGIKPQFSQAISTDKWHQTVMEVKEPFGIWRRQPVAMKDGYLTARIGPEAQARLTTVPSYMPSGTATWYKYKKCLCAASPDFPVGTKLKVALKNAPDKFVVIKVNDYGPDRRLFPSRVIDLDSTAFKLLSPLSAGKIDVTVSPVVETAAATSTLAAAK